jgi:hypothetical protein
VSSSRCVSLRPEKPDGVDVGLAAAFVVGAWLYVKFRLGWF